VNTVGMFFSVRTKKLPFRLLQERWLEAAGFAGFGIHAITMVEPKTGGSAFQVVMSPGTLPLRWQTKLSGRRAAKNRAHR
jgi:hypothetical protein